MLKVPNAGANELKEDLKLLSADLSTIVTHKGLTLSFCSEMQRCKASLRTDAMGCKQVQEERFDQLHTAVALKFSTTKAKNFVASKSKLAILLDHRGVERGARSCFIGVVLLAIDFNDNSSAAGKDQQKIHSLPLKHCASTFSNRVGIVVQVHLGYERRKYLAESGSDFSKVCVKQQLLPPRSGKMTPLSIANPGA